MAQEHSVNNDNANAASSDDVWKRSWHNLILFMRGMFNIQERRRIKRSNSFFEKFNRVAIGPAEDSLRSRMLKLCSLEFWKFVVFGKTEETYYMWLMTVTIAAFYNLTMIVARSVFLQLNVVALPLWLTIDYICDAIYVADVLFSMRVGFLEHGLLVCDPKILRMRYLKSWRFVIDVLSCFPTDAFYPLCPLGIDQTELRLNRILKSYKILEFKELTETRTSHPLIAKMLGLLAVVVVILHWNACAYFLLSDLIGLGSDIFVYPPQYYLELTATSSHSSDSTHSTENASAADHPVSNSSAEYASAAVYETGTHTTDSSLVNTTAYHASESTTNGTETSIDSVWLSLTREYIYCFYWATITQTIIADNPLPQTVGEAAFMIINYTVAVIVFDVIIVTVGSVIRSSNAENEEFQAMMDGVKRYMHFRAVNKRLRKRVMKWFDFLYAHPHHGDDVLHALPDSLRVEIAMSIHYDTLKRVSIFEDCEFSLLMELVTKLKLETFGPGDYVCRKGDIGKEMYIVKRGKLEVVSPDGKQVFVSLNEGSVFGELCVLNIPGNKTEGRRSANVRSFGYSDLFVLRKDDLWDALKEFPDAKKKLVERGAAILRKDKLLDEAAFEAGTRTGLTPLQQLTIMHEEIDSASTKLAQIIVRFNKMQVELNRRLDCVEQNAKSNFKSLASDLKNGTNPANTTTADVTFKSLIRHNSS